MSTEAAQEQSQGEQTSQVSIDDQFQHELATMVNSFTSRGADLVNMVKTLAVVQADLTIYVSRLLTESAMRRLKEADPKSEVPASE